MSHFTVAVITKGKPTYAMIEHALAPYQENNMGDCPKQYLEFHSLSEEYREEYETGTTKRVKMQDGLLVYRWDDRLFDKVSKEDYEKAKAEGKKTVCSPNPYTYKVEKDLAEIGAELVTIPFKELYPTFEEYLEEYHCAEKDEETQDYGYWENPNAKWDWFEVGGRWSGLLKVPLDCSNYGIGQKSWGWGDDDPYTTTDQYRKVDSARIKDLVFLDCQNDYDKAKRFWEIYIEGQEPQNEKEKKIRSFLKKEYYINKFKTKETYAECEATFHTYAIIDKNGHWIAKGEMGWWGISIDTENQEVEYIRNYKKNVFDDAEEDDYITIVDCHI